MHGAAHAGYVIAIHRHDLFVTFTNTTTGLTSAEDVVVFALANAEASQSIASTMLAQYTPALLVSIERCGLSRLGTYLNCRGVDISAHTAMIDYLFTLKPAGTPFDYLLLWCLLQQGPCRSALATAGTRSAWVTFPLSCRTCHSCIQCYHVIRARPQSTTLFSHQRPTGVCLRCTPHIQPITCRRVRAYRGTERAGAAHHAPIRPRRYASPPC